MAEWNATRNRTAWWRPFRVLRRGISDSTAHNFISQIETRPCGCARECQALMEYQLGCMAQQSCGGFDVGAGSRCQCEWRAEGKCSGRLH
jgi:hypothetical protein